VTALAARDTTPPAVAVEIADTGAVREGRPGGRRFGVLVHAVLAALDLAAAAPAAITALAHQRGRIVGATGAEVGAAVACVAAAIAHPLLVRAAAAARRGELRRETPVWLARADGTLAEGVVDLAFREGGAWVVIDFKTDRELAAEPGVYERQVGAYVEAIARATGEPASGVLLRL
jgi:ATP-dependent exoDNAse (exonuclease V) beta subunit